MKILAMKSTVMLIAFLSATPLLAQPPAPPATPIDGGLGILLSGGIIYAMRKIVKQRKH